MVLTKRNDTVWLGFLKRFGSRREREKSCAEGKGEKMGRCLSKSWIILGQGSSKVGWDAIGNRERDTFLVGMVWKGGKDSLVMMARKSVEIGH